MSFELTSSMTPSGDQPQAIAKLVEGLKANVSRQTLLGVTGSGKTFTMANVIAKTNLPTLIISHNKTLAGQLYQEFKELFPKNKVSYFVSYYDYYQPEAYIPSSDTYIAKEVEINDLIDKLRLESTTNLFSGNDNIVVASVSCIYNIGNPADFGGKTLDLSIGTNFTRRQIAEKLTTLFYTRSEMEFKRSQFRIRGPIVEIWPSYADWIVSLEFDEFDNIKTITERHPFTGNEFPLTSYKLFPGKQFVGASGEGLETIYEKIRQDCESEVDEFKKQNKILEAQRLHQRVEYDLEMLHEVGYVNGIENYSIYFENDRRRGDPPYTLVDYFRHLWGDNFLTIIDESHVTIPQIHGMFGGDLARKNNLVEFGFRLKSAYDNRPLKWEEFYSRIPKAIYVSATPSEFEIEDSKSAYPLNHNDLGTPWIVEQIIRPTGLLDPVITVRPTKNQIPDLVEKIKAKVNKGERSLVVTITKKMSEDLAAYLSNEQKVGTLLKVAYLHSDIETLERTEILDKLRQGDFDVLVGINLLREGLDLPEVSFVAILDADSQGFLRSRSSLIQIMGRASRNVDGEVILYADSVSPAMKEAMQEVNRRRQIQIEYNEKHGITPQTIKKSIRERIIQRPLKNESVIPLLEVNFDSLTPPQKKNHLAKMRKEMREAASSLDFEQAIRIRDKVKELEST